MKRLIDGVMLQVLRERTPTPPDCSYCQSPCCKLIVQLTREEAASGLYSHEPGEVRGKIVPVLRKNAQGYCVHRIPSGKCGVYNQRPEVCRTYNCHHDARITTAMKYEAT